MFPLKRQLKSLYISSAFLSFQLAGASWVALLAARGFSLVEIGIAESVFHAVSLCFELPSGVIADVFGRKRSLMASPLMFILSAILMVVSNGLPGILLSVGVSALGYNFFSGSFEALAYDSMKRAGEEGRYDHFSATELMIYRIGRAAAVLLAGLALFLGYRIAYLIDIGIAAAAFCFASFGLTEVLSENVDRTRPVSAQIGSCVRESVGFLRQNGKAIRLMLWNAFVGAGSTLLLFFLQAKLTEDGLTEAALGPALFLIGLGGALGARITPLFRKWSYGKVSVLSVILVVGGTLTVLTGVPLFLILGGFVSGVGDDLLQVRSDVLLNDLVPSEERATLLSVSSLVFSLEMMILSPFAGLFFERV